MLPNSIYDMSYPMNLSPTGESKKKTPGDGSVALARQKLLQRLQEGGTTAGPAPGDAEIDDHKNEGKQDGDTGE